MKIPNESSIHMDALAIFEVKQYGFWLNLKLSHNLDINNDIKSIKCDFGQDILNR